MNKKIRTTLKRIIAVVLIISLLPLSDVSNCFTLHTQAAENDLTDHASENEGDISDVSEGDVSDIIAAQDELPESSVPADNVGATDNEIWKLDVDYTLTQDTEITGLILTDGKLDLNGYKLTVKGNLTQAGGILFVNEGNLVVQGDYLMQSETEGASNGILQMTNAEDSVHIAGDFISDTSRDSSGFLTAGSMEVSGDFVINSNYTGKGFIATDAHKLILSGDKLQTVCFGKSSSADSRLCDLEITNIGEEGVIFESSVNMTEAGNPASDIPYVSGKLTDNGRHVTGFISIGNSTKFTENYFGGSVYVGENTVFDQILTIGGNLKLDHFYDVYISGSVTVKGDLLQSRSRVHMEKGSLEVEGDYTILSNYYSYLAMTHAEDYIHVHGDVNMNSYAQDDSWLTEGTFEAEGDFSAKRGLRASRSHRFLFSGNQKQTISLTDGQCFATIELDNHSEAGVYSEEPFASLNFITNGCRMTYGTYTGEYGWTLEEDCVHEGDLTLIEGILDLNGHKLTVTGDLIQLSGTVLVNGGTLEIQEDYRMQSRRKSAGDTAEDEETDGAYTYGKSSGRLKMSDERDTVLVEGSFISDSMIDSTGDLTAGTMEIHGDIKIGAAHSDKGFVASGQHVLILSGSEGQAVSFVKSGGTISRLANMDIRNTSADGVAFLSDADHVNAVYVSGNVKDAAERVDGFIAIGSTTSFEDNFFSGSVYIGEAANINHDVTIGGDLNLATYNAIRFYGNVRVEGNFTAASVQIYIEKGSLTVFGNFALEQGYRSVLYMRHDEDYIHVYGDVTYNPYNTGAYYLSAGTFEIGGDLISGRGIQAYGTHRFLFSGTGKQTINIAPDEYFQTVELKNESEEGVYSETTFAKQELITNGCHITYGDLQGEYGWTLTEDQVYEGDLVLIEDTLDLNGYSLTVTGDLVQLSGTVFINEGRLTVEGDYRVQFRDGGKDGAEYTYGTSSGYLKMTNAADRVLVKGSYISDSSAGGEDYLTAGVLEIRGDFIVNSTASSKSFIATGTHTVLLSGSAGQIVRFDASSANTSRLNHLEITNAGEEGVVFESTEAKAGDKVYHTNVVYVSGNVNDYHNQVSGLIGIGTGTSFTDSYFGGGIHIGQTAIWEKDVHVKGDMELVQGGDLVIRGNITVEGDFLHIYILNMDHGRLEVYGDYDLLNVHITPDYICSMQSAIFMCMAM